MRALACAVSLLAALAAVPAAAHGPQIQLTNDNNKIVSRRLIQEGPYSNSLTLPTSVYVIRMQPFNSVWYSRPNNSLHPILGTPNYFSGPGFAYGYDQTYGGPQEFAAGSVISLHLNDGLKLWDGAAFGSAGVTQLKAFRGSNVDIASPSQNFAITSEVDPFLSLPAVLVNYGSEGADIHSTVRYALLGDGTSPTSTSPDGVYLLELQLSSTQIGLAASDPFYFVLHKNAPRSAVMTAVSSLGVAGSQVQWVPEPSTAGLLAVAAMGFLARRRRNVRCRSR